MRGVVAAVVYSSSRSCDAAVLPYSKSALTSLDPQNTPDKVLYLSIYLHLYIYIYVECVWCAKHIVKVKATMLQLVITLPPWMV